MSHIRSKKLIFIRHAHRDVLGRSTDHGLSEKGKRQSELIRDQLMTQYSLKDCVLYSSPKLRCIETLNPLAEALNHRIQILSSLDERHSHESETELKKRIQHFLSEWKNSEHAITLACSHGDWLPLAVHQLTTTYADFEKGEWAEISLDSNQFFIRFRD